MPKRSSKNQRPDEDANEAAFDVVRQATEEDEPTGPELLADLIREVREAPNEDPDALALRLWSRLRRIISESINEVMAAESEGLRPSQENRHRDAAAELGSRGGKKGGPARAKKLSPERRSEIAKKAADARWKKGRKP